MDSSWFIGTWVGDLFDVGQGIANDVPQCLDKTLHDLAARILNLSVWRMIGGAGSREVSLYSEAIYIEDVVPEDRPRGIRAVLDACWQDYESGYRAFKLKIGRGRKRMAREKGLQRDIKVTRSVHEHFSDCSVLVDANDAFTVEEACRYVTAVADCNLYWIEEAFEEDADSYHRLREVMEKVGCKALIADGEARREQAQPPTAYGGYTQAFIDRLYKLAEEKLVVLFVLDLEIVGFSRWRRVMSQLRKARGCRHRLMPGCEPCVFTRQHSLQPASAISRSSKASQAERRGSITPPTGCEMASWSCPMNLVSGFVLSNNPLWSATFGGSDRN